MATPWTPKPGDRVVRHPREELIGPVHYTVSSRRAQSRALASPLVLTYVFAGLILLGTAVLMFPFTHVGGGFTPFVDALFTATSATTVTGLVTQNTAEYWTRPGQVVILLLMFVGGLGFMSITTFLMILIGQRVTLAQRLLVKESLQVDHLGGLARLAIQIVLVVTGIQVVGFIVLSLRFSTLYAPGEALWQGLFHSVSGFNNAGFVVLPTDDPTSVSLSEFRLDKIVLGIIGGLIFLGAISFWAMVDVFRYRRFSLFSLNTKLVLILTFLFIGIGAFVFFFSEYNNDETLGALSVADKAYVAVFESISGRTAGFTTVDYGETEQHTNFFFTSLMFIGGASASVAGGIKINTLAVVLVAVLSTLRGSATASVFGRQIPESQVHRAMTIAAAAVMVVFLTAIMLTFSEASKEFPFIDLLFESVSAFGTVGLSTGLTGDLSRWGQVILVVSMFVGRVAPVTLALAMARSGQRDLYRFAPERVTIG